MPFIFRISKRWLSRCIWRNSHGITHGTYIFESLTAPWLTPEQSLPASYSFHTNNVCAFEYRWSGVTRYNTIRFLCLLMDVTFFPVGGRAGHHPGTKKPPLSRRPFNKYTSIEVERSRLFRAPINNWLLSVYNIPLCFVCNIRRETNCYNWDRSLLTRWIASCGCGWGRRDEGT